MDLQRRSDSTPDEDDDLVAVRRLLQGYHEVLQRSEQSLQLPRSATRRWLRYRIASARMRHQLTRLSRSLHSRLARQPSAEDDAILGSIDHFQASLPPPTSTLARTGFAVCVILLTQFLSLFPLVPVESGSAKVPTLGTLSEALDLAPSHLIRAASTLLHSSAPTILAFLSTLSLGLFLAFAPALPDIKIVRRLFDDAHSASASDLEQRAARRLGCRRAARRNLDLAIWAPLAACLICLSAAWMAGYVGGIRRWDVAPTLRSTRVVISTQHPRYLETFAALLFAGGVALVWALVVLARRRTAGDRPAPADHFALPWYLQMWTAAVLVGVGFIVNRGFIAYAASHGLKLTIVASGTTTTRLALDPAIRISVDCPASSCGITRAALQRGVTDFEGFADARAIRDRQLDLFDIDTSAVRPDTSIDDEQTLANNVRFRRIDGSPALADLGLRPQPETPRAKRYSLTNSAMYWRAGDLNMRACMLLLNDGDLRTVGAEVRRRRIFEDGTVFLPLQLWFGTDERGDNATLRVFVPVKSA